MVRFVFLLGSCARGDFVLARVCVCSFCAGVNTYLGALVGHESTLPFPCPIEGALGLESLDSQNALDTLCFGHATSCATQALHYTVRRALGGWCGCCLCLCI